jgi:hypothetical protein
MIVGLADYINPATNLYISERLAHQRIHYPLQDDKRFRESVKVNSVPFYGFMENVWLSWTG